MGLVKRLDYKKGSSVCWSTRVQRPHIVSLAGVGFAVLSIAPPPPFRSLAQLRTKEGEESAFSLMGELEHEQELGKEGS